MKPWVKIHNAIEATADSVPIDCRGYNALAVYATFSAAQNWTFSVQGSMTLDGPLVPVLYNGTALSKQTNASGLLIFANVPNYVVLRATEDVNGAVVTVYAAPCIV
jgi:hypothetical protein